MESIKERRPPPEGADQKSQQGAESPGMLQALTATPEGRRALRRRQQSRASSKPAWNDPTILHIPQIEGEEETVEVGLHDKLPDGHTREDQLAGNVLAETIADGYVTRVLGDIGRELYAQLEAFRAAAPSHTASLGDVPGQELIGYVGGELWKLLKKEVPFLSVFESSWSLFSTRVGVAKSGVKAIAAGAKLAGERGGEKSVSPDLKMGGASMNVASAAQGMIANATRAWADTAARHKELVAGSRADIHSAYASAPAGKGKEAVELLLAGKGIVVPEALKELSLALENQLDDAIFHWKCGNDILFQLGRSALCAVE